MINLEELEKLESEVLESNEAAERLEKEKVKRIMSCNIGPRNVIFWGLEFKEIEEKKPDLVDEQVFKFKPKIIRPRKFLVLGHSGDIEKIKEIIKEFFKENSKTKNIVRINKSDPGNEKIISEIKEFTKQESSKIDFPDAKIKVVTCNLAAEANNKSKYTDARSEAYYGLRNLFKNKQIELSLPELKTEIMGQFSAVNFESEGGRDKAIVPEDNQELVEALIFFVWIWGMSFGFIRVG